MRLMPNSSSLDIGRAEPLPVPMWARANLTTRRNHTILSPLDIAATSRMMGFGLRTTLWIRPPVSQAERNRIASGSWTGTVGRTMLYSPLGSGRAYQ